MEEVFMRYSNYQNHVYEVSNLGNVKIDGKLIPYEKLSNWGGYKELYWHNTVHKAVARLFIENPDNKPEIDHIDGNPNNNRASNLRWVTHSENLNNPITKERKLKSIKAYYSNPENRQKVSDYMKQYCKTDQGREHIKKMTKLSPTTQKGYVKSEEHIKKITEKIRGRKNTIEQNINISNKTKEAMKDLKIKEKCRLGGLHAGRLKWMHNTEKAIRVEPNEIEKYIKLGYSLGRGKIHK